jgi:hypothetical protein
MADHFPGIVRHKCFQFCFGALMIQKGLPGATVETGKFRPGIRGGHIDEPDRLDTGFGRLNTKLARGLAALDAAPEFAFCRDDEVLVERIGSLSAYGSIQTWNDELMSGLQNSSTSLAVPKQFVA